MSEPGKINNLKTKNLPPLFMMCGGAVALLICLIRGTELLKTLIVVFLALLIFALSASAVTSKAVWRSQAF